MKQRLLIKNMVCNRCIATVLHELNRLEFTVKSIELGEVVVEDISESNMVSELDKALKAQGFEIINDESHTLIEAIKRALIAKLESDNSENLIQFLTKRFDKSYSVLSKIFSKTEGITIEKYDIILKIEKVKELIQYGELNFSQIAYSLNYKSSSHLARQFKTVTGMPMTDYKNLQNWNRKKRDQIVSK